MPNSIQKPNLVTINSWERWNNVATFYNKVNNPDTTVWKVAKIALLIKPIAFGIAWILDYFWPINKQVQIIDQNKFSDIKIGSKKASDKKHSSQIKDRPQTKSKDSVISGNPKLPTVKKIKSITESKTNSNPEVKTDTKKSKQVEGQSKSTANTKRLKPVIKDESEGELKKLQGKNIKPKRLVEIDPNSELGKKIADAGARNIPEEFKDHPRIHVLVNRKPVKNINPSESVEPAARSENLEDNKIENKKDHEPLSWRKIALVAGLCILAMTPMVGPMFDYAMNKNKNSESSAEDEVYQANNSTMPSITHSPFQPGYFSCDSSIITSDCYVTIDLPVNTTTTSLGFLDAIDLTNNSSITLGSEDTLLKFSTSQEEPEPKNLGASFISWFGDFISTPAKDSLKLASVKVIV
jgi:hypothetical protein